jgi:amidase
VIDPADIPTGPGYKEDTSEVVVLVYEFKRDLNAYLATRSGVPVRTLAEAIAFNTAHADAELPYFGQEWFEQAEAAPYSEEEYRAALERIDANVRRGGLDRVLAEQRLDALVTLTQGPAWVTDLVNGDHAEGGSSSPSAQAGYPIVTVPGGFVGPLPVGISFLGGAFSEPVLLRLAHAFEQATQHRQPPGFLERWPE